MTYTILAAFTVAIAFVVVLGATRILFKRNWFLGWLRGMAGFCLVAIACVLSLMAWDISSYKQLTKEQPIASLSFQNIGPQEYEVNLVDASGTEKKYRLMGDLWQLDARILKWNNLIAAMGVEAGYRLDRLSGRYYSLEKERSNDRTVYDLAKKRKILGQSINFDIWGWLKSNGRSMKIVDASYGSATYLPMEDGALFSVTLSSTGLVARPANKTAKAAVALWE